MFQKFQTLKHLKVNLDQEHFTKLKIYFKNHIITKTLKSNINYEWFLTPAISPSLFLQYILERSCPNFVLFFNFSHIKVFL